MKNPFWTKRETQLKEIQSSLSQAIRSHSVSEAVVLKDMSKSEYKIIQEIHDSYDTACEKILAEANAILEKAANIDTSTADRLKKLGFVSVPEVGVAEKIQRDVATNRKRAELINYYVMNYPNQKFITREQVAEINKKYNLVCVKANAYKGTIPLKNIAEIEAFVVKEDDIVHQLTTRSAYSGRTTTENFVIKPKTAVPINNSIFDGQAMHINTVVSDGKTYVEEPFYISCPLKDTKVEEGYSVKADGFITKDVIEPKDPIVLKPVRGGFLIVTKWGLEASDPISVNSRDN